MIEIKELRIGNLLNYKGKNVHTTSLSLDIDDEYQDIIGFCEVGKNTNEIADWNRHFAQDLKGIPLTPEILEKCGSMILPNWNTFGNSIIIVNSETGIIYTETELIGVSIINNNEGELIQRSISYFDNIKSLHQLQNLYFALTGQELQVKL